MQLRKDYILNRWSYVSAKRHKRPRNFKGDDLAFHHPEDCPFCAGKEYLTPPEEGRVEKEKGKWIVRWVPNKYPAMALDYLGKVISDNEFFKAYFPYGHQEIIIETPDEKQMVDFSYEHLMTIFKVYNHRIEELSKIEGIKYVLVFKNKGKEAGASLIHSHSQVFALGRIPSAFQEKLEIFKTYQKCPYCQVIEDERRGPRNVFENEYFFAFTPYAPRFNYEIWIFPKRHMKKLNEMNENEYLSLAKILHKILDRLNKINASYCFYLEYAPLGYDFHWHIEILPRLNIRAGFELSGGDSVITVSPEEAAFFYRETRR